MAVWKDGLDQLQIRAGSDLGVASGVANEILGGRAPYPPDHSSRNTPLKDKSLGVAGDVVSTRFLFHSKGFAEE